MRVVKVNKQLLNCYQYFPYFVLITRKAAYVNTFPRVVQVLRVVKDRSGNDTLRDAVFDWISTPCIDTPKRRFREPIPLFNPARS